MATGLYTLASLLVALSAAPPDHWATNHRSLSVPVKFVERRSDLRQMILYVSSDRGRTWTESAVAPPDKESFPFYAPTDGMYWMKLCAVYRDGTRSPADVSKGEAALKILVDTLKPVVRIVSAERQGDSIAVRWEIQEEHPDLRTLKMDYRSAEDAAQQWYTVPLEPVLNGSVQIRYPAAGGLTIRLQASDTAKNTNMDTFDVPPAGFAHRGAEAPIVQASAMNVPSGPSVLPNIPPAYNPPPPLPPPATNVGWERADAHVAPRPSQETWGGRALATASDTASRGPAGFDAGSGPAMPSRTFGTEPARRPQRGALPPKQIVNSPEVVLEYQVQGAGPAGVGRVEVWITEDKGETWRLHASSEKSESTTLKIVLPGEKEYGLRLLALSRVGHGKPPPQPGDPPELVVEVDQTVPHIEILPPVPDPRHRNTLTLSWIVSDPNLTANPITLEWSVSSNGPWNVIHAGLPNTGHYSWHVRERTPEQVFLRLGARDLAGNEDHQVTQQPVLVDLSEPEARLIRVISTPTPQPPQ